MAARHWARGDSDDSLVNHLTLLHWFKRKKLLNYILLNKIITLVFSEHE